MWGGVDGAAADEDVVAAQGSGGDDGDGDDGGGGNQILINGKRTAGKNNQASTQLNRIAAGQVDYIEIIRGTSGDLDVRGSGQVINVVLFEDLSTSSLSYEAMTAYTWDHEANPGGAAGRATPRLTRVRRAGGAAAPAPVAPGKADQKAGDRSGDNFKQVWHIIKE